MVRFTDFDVGLGNARHLLDTFEKFFLGWFAGFLPILNVSLGLAFGGLKVAARRSRNSLEPTNACSRLH